MVKTLPGMLTFSPEVKALASTWPSLGHCGHIESELVDGRYLSLCNADLTINKFLFFFLKKKILI